MRGVRGQGQGARSRVVRIGVDARELAGRATGVGRYLGEMLACWSRDPAAAAHEITLFTPGPLALPAGLIGAGGARISTHVVGGGPVDATAGAASRAARSRAGDLPTADSLTSAPAVDSSPRVTARPAGEFPALERAEHSRPAAGVLWEQTRLALAVRSRADVMFGPGYSVPMLAGMPSVVTLHDVSFCAHPEWFGPREGLRRRLLARAAARRARRVLTMSEFSRDEIVRLLGISAEKIRVIPLAAGGFFDPAVAAAPPSPAADAGAEASTAPPSGRGQPVAEAAREPMVLYVGSIFNRRHVPTLLRAFAPVGRSVPAARLVIVGDNRTRPREDLDALARDLGIAPQVRITAYVSDEELADLYRRARAFAFLSTYEGFALTPLEALAAGVPSILFDTPVAREVFRDAALFVPPGDELGVTAALRALLDHPPVHAHYLTEGAALLRDYSWSRTASETLAVLLEAAGARPHA
jgi:glycosyltransferase involved in cell wall biosynthesis